jgi:hypothetical protein
MPSVQDLPEDTVRDNGQPNLVPQNHGLLTDSLSLDFASLRSEVQNFFAQIDNLGARATDRQIGIVLYSGAVVVAAAMACEVARRQARRPASGSAFVLSPQLDLRNEPDAPSGIGLPNLAQFSTFS